MGGGGGEGGYIGQKLQPRHLHIRQWSFDWAGSHQPWQENTSVSSPGATPSAGLHVRPMSCEVHMPVVMVGSDVRGGDRSVMRKHL